MMRYTNRMTPEEEKLSTDAYNVIKARNGKDTIEFFLESGKYQPSNTPIALFMAGSPGAGKTEVSKSFIKQFKDAPIRIDADEIRAVCEGYTGDNAHIFQRAATKGVNILQDHALHNSINYILDGTFAYGSVETNIERALKYNFLVKIWFVYQSPETAWNFTKIREEDEDRHVSKEVFVNAFFRARENVGIVKEKFNKDIELNLLVKNYETGEEKFKLNINAKELDQLTNCGYSEEELMTNLI